MHFIILTKMKGVNHPVCEYDVLHCKQGLNYNNDNNNNQYLYRAFHNKVSTVLHQCPGHLVIWSYGQKQILLSFSEPWRVYSSELPCSSRGFFKHIIKHIINLYHRKYPFRPLGGEKQLQLSIFLKNTSARNDV